MGLIQILLLGIFLILLLGASTVLGVFSFIFWVVIIIAGVIGLFALIGYSKQDSAEKDRKNKEEAKLRKKYEKENPYAPRKTWLGLTVQKIKSKETVVNEDEF